MHCYYNIKTLKRVHSNSQVRNANEVLVSTADVKVHFVYRVIDSLVYVSKFI